MKRMTSDGTCVGPPCTNLFHLEMTTGGRSQFRMHSALDAVSRSTGSDGRPVECVVVSTSPCLNASATSKKKPCVLYRSLYRKAGVLAFPEGVLRTIRDTISKTQDHLLEAALSNMVW